MQVDLKDVTPLRFPDGSPVRAASAVAPLGEGYLVAQDDATHAAWVTPRGVTEVRLLPPVAGLDTFEESSGTKHLKPDLEAACPVEVDGDPAALLMGSGSSPARMRWALVRLRDGRPVVGAADLTPLYARVAARLGVELDVLNLEGACVVGGRVRWFHRGLPSAALPSGSVDLDLGQALAAVGGRVPAEAVDVTSPRSYDLGAAAGTAGVGLAVTDAVALPDGTILLSAAAENSPNPRDEGPVTGAALVRLADGEVERIADLPRVEGRVAKVEGLMVVEAGPDDVLLRAVVDDDDPGEPSLALLLRVRW